MRLIDADKLIKSYLDHCRTEFEIKNCCMADENVINIIDNAPTVEERPQGEWIIVKDERYGDNVKCPFCGKELAGTDLNFCCKCGARMEADNERKN